MKTKKLEKKLVLNKETITDLNNREMSNIQGGSKLSVCPCIETLVVSKCRTDCEWICL
jgi:hypothetical protein